MKYKTIDIRTLKGLKHAERLQAYGWKVVEVGFNTVTMAKETKKSYKWIVDKENGIATRVKIK